MVGFGELFRMISYQEDIGSAAILSRAIAGVVKDKVVFSTPGSTGAVKLAMNKLILPEIGHVVRELKKDL
jgi:molybdenum cofactor biosynthesis protein B